MATTTFVHTGANFRGDYTAGSVIRIPWACGDTPTATNSRTEGEIRVVSSSFVTANLVDGSGNVLVDGSGNALTVQIRDTTEGVTDTRNDLFPGVNLVEIDTSVSDFYVSGGREYWVVWQLAPFGQTYIISSFTLQRPSQVATDVDSLLRLLTDTNAELASIPAFPMDAITMLKLLATVVLHKREQDTDSEQIFKANGTTVLGTRATASAGGTVTQGALTNPA